MAPKRSRKEASTSVSYDKSRFPDQAAYTKFITTISKRKLVPERVFDIEEGFFPDIDRIIDERGWHTLCRVDPGPAVIPIVREFYTLADSKKGSSVTIRGKTVSFTKAAINRHFNLPPTPVDEFNAYAVDEPNLAEVIAYLCPYSDKWDDKQRNAPHFPRGALSSTAKVWFYFVCARLIPAIHRCDVTKDRAILIYCILTGKAIDVGNVIHSMIMLAIRSTGVSLLFPSLITNLCRTAGVQWDASEEHLQTESPLNYRMIMRLNNPVDKDTPTSEAATSEPIPPAPEDRLAAIETGLQQLRSHFYEHHQWAAAQAAYQVECNQSLHQMMQQCALSMGATSNPTVPWPTHPTPPQFLARDPDQDENDDS